MYGELDSRINGGIPAIEAAMQQNNNVYEKIIYPNADHAFHNDTGPRYNPALAQQCYAIALELYKRRLGEGDLMAAKPAAGTGETKH